MKTATAGALAMMAAGLVGAGYGQQADKSKLMSPNEKSPPMETTATLGEKQIWIVYHAPSARGRKIFGGEGALVPDGKPWRLGADWATVLHTDATLDLNGVTVPPGDYSLFLNPDQGEWKLIVNKQTGQWGIKRSGDANFDPANNVGEAAMKMSAPAEPAEHLKISLASAGEDKGTLTVEWADKAGSVPFTVK
jgi:hypothetical protein